MTVFLVNLKKYSIFQHTTVTDMCWSPFLNVELKLLASISVANKLGFRTLFEPSLFVADFQ